MSSTSAVDASNQAVSPVWMSTLPPLGENSSLRPRGSAALAGCAEASRLAVSRTGAARFPPRHVMFRACEERLAERVFEDVALVVDEAQVAHGAAEMPLVHDTHESGVAGRRHPLDP